MLHEVHIQAGRGRELAQLLPVLRFNAACDPHGIPPGTECYQYPVGREREFEGVASGLGILYAWGVLGILAVALTAVGDLAYVLGGNGLILVDVSNPSNISIAAAYNLAGQFAVNQFAPSALVGNGINVLYVQNADDSIAPSSPSFFAVYDITNPLAMTQQGTVNLGVPTMQRAYEGNSVVGSGAAVYSLLGGDNVSNAAKLRKIDASVLSTPTVIAGPVDVGTFADQPRKLFLLGSSLYVLSGSFSTGNQKVFVYNTSLVLQSTLLINDVSAFVGLRNFYVADGVIYMMAGTGSAGNTNLVLYSTAGAFLGATTVTTGPSGVAIVGA